jgi:ribose 5-phosphate isomerase B
MRIALGSDEITALTGYIVGYLQEQGHTVELAGALREGDEKLWPHVGYTVSKMVLEGGCDTGIACCWTGTGVAMAANKVPGARAALCWDAPTARGARLWDDANILALSLRYTSEVMAREIMDAWLQPVQDGERDDEDRRGIGMMAEVEARCLVQKRGGGTNQP